MLLSISNACLASVLCLGGAMRVLRMIYEYLYCNGIGLSLAKVGANE